MRRVAAMVSAAMMLSACTTYQQSRKVAIAGGVASGVSSTAVLVGLMAAAENASDDAAPFTCGHDSTCIAWSRVAVASLVASSLSWVVLTGGVVGMFSHRRVWQDEQDELDRTKMELEVERRRIPRERAWSITKQVAASARGGSCTDIVARDQEVRDIDPEFHATVFVRDVAISECLAKAGIPVIAPLAPPPPPPRDPRLQRGSAADSARCREHPRRCGGRRG